MEEPQTNGKQVETGRLQPLASRKETQRQANFLPFLSHAKSCLLVYSLA